jgi:lysophospholipase L1-like esterase
MEFKPYKILLFVASVLGLMALPTLFASKQGIKITDSYSFHYPTLAEFFSKGKTEKKNINKITDRLDKKFAQKKVDSLKKHTNADLSQLKLDADSTEESIDVEGLQKLEFGEEGAKVLYAFFAKARSGKKLRVLHYGDSQIEGDRMTGYIREKLQTKFGGYGPGLVPFFNVYHTMTFKQTLSEQFKRYTSFGDVSKDVKHRSYGVMGSFARFTKIETSDSLIDAMEETEAWMEISPSNSAYGHARTYNKVSLYYGNCKRPIYMEVHKDGELIHADSLTGTKSVNVVELSFASTPATLRYTFKGKYSADFYCVNLEGAGGINVDNIAMRGASGTFVNSLDQTQLRYFYDRFGAELFIMQFGGNTVPSLQKAKDPEKATDNYTNHFASQLKSLKKMRPDAAIVVIGPSDMSTKTEDEWKTFEILPYLVKKMKEVTKANGAAYWDMYTAMGGENSMPTWVEKDLAGPDYTHFSPGGARYISEMFYEALIYEYQKYVKKEKTETVEEGEIQK